MQQICPICSVISVRFMRFFRAFFVRFLHFFRANLVHFSALIPNRCSLKYGGFYGNVLQRFATEHHDLKFKAQKRSTPPMFGGVPPVCLFLFVNDYIGVFLFDFIPTNRFAQRVLHRDYLLRLIFQTIKVFLPEDRCNRV